MKRDMDLCREILSRVEESRESQGFLELDIGDRSDVEISYHVKLLSQAGLIEARDLSSADGLCWKPVSLTYDGHEFLEATRSEKLWTKAKETTLRKTGGLALEVVKAVAIELAKSTILG